MQASYCSASFSVLALKCVAVVGRPPVFQISLAVGAAALVVEAVGDLVADDRADRAVVDRIVGVGIKERRLKNAGGEDDLVHRRIVIGVDGRGGHVPFIAIDRLAQAEPIAGGLRSCWRHHILHVGIAADLQTMNNRARFSDSRF